MLLSADAAAIVAATDTASLLVQLALGGFGVAGLVGAGVALFKLRPDVNSAAVVQAQGAMEAMRSVNEALSQENAHLRKRADDCDTELAALKRERGDLVREVLNLRAALGAAER